jgi:L-threonylcarbamoyladenylate synthase
VLPANSENLQIAAKIINEGKLCSFPTETVYGLGANALNAEACQSIFTTKGRPLTDPLIVHVKDMEAAMPLILQDDK